jgi:hypothetical protein
VNPLRAAAFGDRPDADLPLSPDADGLDRWLAAVVLGGQGRYARAAGLLTGLLADPDPVLAALAGSTRASHLRQLGGHDQARRYDAEAARRLATTHRPARTHRPDVADDPHGVGRRGALVDVLLGLAADAIGLGRPAVAARLHDAAMRAAARDETWRVTVRIEWVATELALATGRPAAAVPHAERAVALSTVEGGTRHTVKSTMMLGAALTAEGTPDGRSRAEALLTDAVAVSLTRGMFPLVWPCALLLADLLPERAAHYTSLVGSVLTSIFSWSDPAMRRISAASVWMPTSLIRSGEPTRTSVELTT